MFERKISFISSNDSLAKKSLKQLKKKYKSVKPEDSDIIIALGGDGTILETFHQN